MKEKFSSDFEKMRGGLLEIIATNRQLNTQLSKEMEGADFKLVEEYVMLTKTINESIKQLTEMYKFAPEIISKIDKHITPEKKKLNLDDMLNSDT